MEQAALFWANLALRKAVSPFVVERSILDAQGLVAQGPGAFGELLLESWRSSSAGSDPAAIEEALGDRGMFLIPERILADDSVYTSDFQEQFSAPIEHHAEVPVSFVDDPTEEPSDDGDHDAEGARRRPAIRIRDP